MKTRFRTPLGITAPDVHHAGEMEVGQVVLLARVEYEVTGVLSSIEPGVDQFVILDAVLTLADAGRLSATHGFDPSR